LLDPRADALTLPAELRTAALTQDAVLAHATSADEVWSTADVLTERRIRHLHKAMDCHRQLLEACQKEELHEPPKADTDKLPWRPLPPPWAAAAAAAATAATTAATPSGGGIEDGNALPAPPPSTTADLAAGLLDAVLSTNVGPATIGPLLEAVARALSSGSATQGSGTVTPFDLCPSELLSTHCAVDPVRVAANIGSLLAARQKSMTSAGSIASSSNLRVLGALARIEDDAEAGKIDAAREGALGIFDIARARLFVAMGAADLHAVGQEL
jgi:hypothetical protein